MQNTMREFFFFSSRRRHTRWNCDWSSDVCSSDLEARFWRRSRSPVAPTLRIVDGEGGLVQIALELKTRLLNKLLVSGLAGNRRQLAGGVEFTNPLQIDVEETVRAR